MPGGRRGQRLRPHHQEDVRNKIKASQIVNFLTETIVNGEFQGKEVNPVRVTAALGLLRKILPDLQSTELEANVTTFTDTLKRIAEARNGGDLAQAIPIVAPLSPETDDSDAADAA